MTDIPMLATWSEPIAAHVTGDSCRHCGTAFAAGDTVYLGLERPDKLVVAYCSREHYDAGPADAVADPG